MGAKIGKTPILVGDSSGFVVNRVLIPYLREAILMATEGVPVTEIDDAMKRWGMPMGPFELLDEIGLDVAAYVFNSLARNDSETGMPLPLRQAIEKGWLGKKTGRGFYLHAKSKKKKAKDLTPNNELAQMFWSDDPKSASADEIQWRLVLPMVNEAAAVLDDRVIASADALDLTTVLGLGLAPFRGGIVQFVNAVGPDEIVRRLEEITARHGERFAPATLLREAARTHQPLAPPARPEAVTPRDQIVHT